MIVFVQIPCLNEEATLPLVLASIPRTMPGVDRVEILVIDDGSTDKTIEVARNLGVTHFVRHVSNEGLARSFRDGVDYALAHGADIVVNTDGDNQYPQDRIPDLIRPIIDGDADIVVADRRTSTVHHFSMGKKLLQRIGSKVVSVAASTDLPDAASGFRAYSRHSLIRLNIITRFSYCMETIIQAGNKGLRIETVPVKMNEKTRESRLFKNPLEHVARSAGAIIRSYVMFKPYIVFTVLGTLLGVLGLVPLARYAVLLAAGSAGGHLQSIILGVFLLVASLLCFALMVISDLQRTNRALIEESLERVKSIQYGVDRPIG